MRIIIIEPRPNYGGGSEQVSLSLAQYLKRQGHSLFLLHDYAGTMLPAYEAIVSRTIQFALPGLARRRPVRTVIGIDRLGRAIQDLNIDVAFTSYLGLLHVAPWLSLLMGARVCFHLGLPCPWTSRYSRWSYAKTAAGIAPSDHCAQTWLDGGWPARSLHVIANGVDTTRFSTPGSPRSVRQELALPQDSPLIVFVGRICYDKGVTELVAAFADLAAIQPEAYLVVAGRVEAGFEGAFDAALKRLTPAMRHRVIIRPATATPEKYYAAASVVAVPSVTEEPFGLTFIEALATGVPVIASRMKTFVEIAGADAEHCLVPTGDVGALKDGLARSLAHRAVVQAAALRLQAVVRARYTADASARRYEQLFYELVAANTGGGVPLFPGSAVGSVSG